MLLGSKGDIFGDIFGGSWFTGYLAGTQNENSFMRQTKFNAHASVMFVNDGTGNLTETSAGDFTTDISFIRFLDAADFDGDGMFRKARQSIQSVSAECFLLRRRGIVQVIWI